MEFSDETKSQLLQIIPNSFKLIWDGTLSPLGPIFQDSYFINTINKRFVESLHDLRLQTMEDVEPQVTLLHGPETESIVKSCLVRIKVEQQEAQEEIKRRAKEFRLAQRIANGEDEDEEEEEEE